jgi:phosphoribosylformylglycinamidine synthase PurS subunit
MGMNFEVLVQLKGEVLDPEGRAIQETLKSQGISNVTAVQVAKRYVLTIEGDPKTAEAAANDIAARYLANPVAQTFSVKRLTS